MRSDRERSCAKISRMPKPILVSQHAAHEGPGYVADCLHRAGIHYTVVDISAGAALPARIDGFSGFIFMGGPMSVNDPLPWIDTACALIRAAHGKGVPVLGHCLGGQLIAKALGGAVIKNPVREIGWLPVEVSHNAVAREWFGDVRSFDAFHWHGETFSLPPGATHILASRDCAQQGFALGNTLALQCHIEMTAPLVKQWCEVGAEELRCVCPTVQDASAMQQQLGERIEALQAVAERVYARWLRALA